MEIKLYVNGEFKELATELLTCIRLETKANIESPETLKLCFSDNGKSLKIPESKSTKIEIEIDGNRINSFYYSGSSWVYPPGTLEITATGIDIFGIQDSKIDEDLDLLNVPLKRAFPLIMGKKIEVLIDERLQNKAISLGTQGKNRGEILKEISKMFGVAPISRDGKILFYLDDYRERKRHTLTPDNITKIYWADSTGTTPTGIAVPYTDEDLQTVYYIEGEKASPIKIADTQDSLESARRLAKSLYNQAQSKKYNLRVELAEVNLRIKAGSILKLKNLKSTIDHEYILTECQTELSSQKRVMQVFGRLLFKG